MACRVAHGTDCLRPVLEHRLEHDIQLLTRIPKGNLTLGEREDVEFVGRGGDLPRTGVLKAHDIVLEPFPVGFCGLQASSSRRVVVKQTTHPMYRQRSSRRVPVAPFR